MHPVVAAYVEGRSGLTEVIDGLPNRSPLVDAIRALLLAQQMRANADAALAQAAAVGAEGEDPALYLMFLEIWASLSQRMRRHDEVGALVSRARSMVSPEVPPELIAVLTRLEIEHREDLSRRAPQGRAWEEVLKVLPESSPRRWHALMDHAFFLAQRGRLGESETELRALAEGAGSSGRRMSVDLARYIDCAECGRAAQAAALAARLDMDSTLVRSNLNGVIYAGAILELAAGTLTPEELADPAQADPVRQLRAAPWVHSTFHLRAGRAAEALSWARRYARDFSGLDTMFAFQAYTLIRAELAAGRADAAARLMSRRAEAGNGHYLDGLFLARIELLRGRPGAAAEHFAGLLAEVDRHDARGRLDFELRLAGELSPGQVVQLTRAAGQPRPQAAAGGPVREEAALPESLVRLIGRSPAMGKIREEIGRYAPLDVLVLIVGETGTGKELAARALHEAGWRREEPFLAVNCAAIAEPLLESELFGHEKGAFTGAASAHRGLLEEAGRGTLLLDEIGEIGPRLQAALLRVLESGEIRRVGAGRPNRVACRLVAATNAPLEELVGRGAFRRDLYYRLRRVEIRMPALRDRGDDVLLLAGHFLDRDRPGGGHARMTDALRAALCAHRWPGNVRELRNEIERMRLMSSEALSFDVADLPPEIRGAPGGRPQGGVSGEEAGEKARSAAKAPAERSPEISRVLAESRTRLRRTDRLRELFRQHGRLTRAEIARVLGVSPKTVTRDLKGLVEEGFVERVEPSASLRSRYFRLRRAPES